MNLKILSLVLISIHLASASNALTSGNFSSPACDIYDACNDCIGSNGCGWCATASLCVPGTWKGPLDTQACGKDKRLDYMYHQCIVTNKNVFIASSAVISMLLLAIGTIICCCCCSNSHNTEDPHLHPQYQRRSSTYYNWNRTPVNSSRTRKPIHTWSTNSSSSIYIPTPSKNQNPKPGFNIGGGRYGSLSDSPNRVVGEGDSSNSREEDYLSPSRWESRRADLLKKYGRSEGSS